MKEELIGKIRFVNMIDEDDAIHCPVIEMARKYILSRNDKLIERGIHKVELDTMGGYHFRGISQARFLPLTTMHMLRLLKR